MGWLTDISTEWTNVNSEEQVRMIQYTSLGQFLETAVFLQASWKNNLFDRFEIDQTSSFLQLFWRNRMQWICCKISLVGMRESEEKKCLEYLQEWFQRTQGYRFLEYIKNDRA